MSQSVEELKEHYDNAIAEMLKLHRKETIKALLNVNSGNHSGFSVDDLKVEEFLNEHIDTLRELNSEECMELVRTLVSAEE